MAIHTVAELVVGVLYATGAGFQTFDTLRHSKKFYNDLADRAWIRPAEILIRKLLVPNSVVVTVL